MFFPDDAEQCYARVYVLADGVKCQEYSVSYDQQGGLKCYIALAPGQEITLLAELDMNSEHFELDTFADGVIRNYAQSTRNPANTHRKQIFEIPKGIYRVGRSLYRTPMVTSLLSHSLNTGGVHRAHVGSIGIVISKQDKARASHAHGFMTPDTVPHGWYEQGLASSSMLLRPSMQLRFEGGERLIDSERSGARDKLARHRQGQSPWIRFTFVYRQYEQLQALDLLKQSNPIFPSTAQNQAASSSSGTGQAFEIRRPDDVQSEDMDVNPMRPVATPTLAGSTEPKSSFMQSLERVKAIRSDLREIEGRVGELQRMQCAKGKEIDAILAQAPPGVLNKDSAVEMGDTRASQQNRAGSSTDDPDSLFLD